MSKILKIGNSHGIILDTKTRAEAGLAPGDEVVTAAADDGIYIAKKGSRAASVIEAAKAVMERDSRVFEILKDR
jgi:hypothetical protein